MDNMIVEIAILSAFPHQNVVGLIDAYFLDNKLSVRELPASPCFWF